MVPDFGDFHIGEDLFLSVISEMWSQGILLHGVLGFIAGSVRATFMEVIDAPNGRGKDENEDEGQDAW